jgi:hypothetical protein
LLPASLLAPMVDDEVEVSVLAVPLVAPLAVPPVLPAAVLPAAPVPVPVLGLGCEVVVSVLLPAAGGVVVV